MNYTDLLFDLELCRYLAWLQWVWIWSARLARWGTLPFHIETHTFLRRLFEWLQLPTLLEREPAIQHIRRSCCRSGAEGDGHTHSVWCLCSQSVVSHTEMCTLSPQETQVEWEPLRDQTEQLEDRGTEGVVLNPNKSDSNLRYNRCREKTCSFYFLILFLLFYRTLLQHYYNIFRWTNFTKVFAWC